jgi:3-oxoacyl-[acyl-carrier-protein] synthase II
VDIFNKSNGGQMERRRVVITGMGVVSPLGCSVNSFWDGLINGRSGIQKITHFDPSELPCQIAGQVPDFDPLQYMERKSARRMPRSTQFAVAVARQAVEDAGLPSPVPEPERTAVVIATAVGGLENLSGAYDIFKEKGYDRMPPTMLPSGIVNMPAFQVAYELQCLGPNNTVATACAAGTQSIGEGSELIRRDAADVVIAGGAEAIVIPIVTAAFCAMRALPVNFNDRPEQASRPFDALREGFLISEGAAAVVLESLDHAQARGARIYAEVAGHSSSSDAYDMVALHPDGLGPIRAMRWALENAGVKPEQVDYINAHGTSTALNDRVETLAIKNVFGDSAYDVPISSTKSMLGHAMGASGSLEAVACTMAINHGIIPPTINYENPDPECDLYYVPNQAIQRKVNVALSNSFGLGGQNACLVLKAFNAN